MVNATQIQEHMEIIGSDGKHVGTVDRVEGNRIKLTKTDQAAQGQHHYLPLDAIASIDQNRLRLNQTASQIQQQWQGGGAQGQASGKSSGSSR
jgi:hypothetical protein